MNTQHWSPLGWTGWISLQSKGLTRAYLSLRITCWTFWKDRVSDPALGNTEDRYLLFKSCLVGSCVSCPGWESLDQRFPFPVPMLLCGALWKDESQAVVIVSTPCILLLNEHTNISIKWSQLLRSWKCEERLRKWEGLIPGSGSSPGEGNGSPLQYSGLGNPMDRGSWRATIYGIMKSQTWLNTQARRGDGCVSLWICQMSLNCSL